jgi:hypothetical protein
VLTFRRTDGVFGQLAGAYNGLAGGATLGKDARLSLLGIGESRARPLFEEAKRWDDFYRGQAAERKIRSDKLGPNLNDMPTVETDKINSRKPKGVEAAPERKPKTREEALEALRRAGSI